MLDRIIKIGCIVMPETGATDCTPLTLVVVALCALVVLVLRRTVFKQSDEEYADEEVQRRLAMLGRRDRNAALELINIQRVNNAVLRQGRSILYEPAMPRSLDGPADAAKTADDTTPGAEGGLGQAADAQQKKTQ